MGNRRQFDEAEVLTLMTEHFWRHGYAGTKVDQLSELTGLTKTSIYNAFGNKEALFLRVVDFYVEQQFGPALQVLDAQTSLHLNVKNFLSHFFSKTKNENVDCGCLVTNSILEFSDNEPNLHEAVRARYTQTRLAMHGFFSQYSEAKRLPSGVSVDEFTNFFMTFFQGLRVQSRGGGLKKDMDSSIRTFLTYVKVVEQSPPGRSKN